MLFPVKVETKLHEVSMLSRNFISEQSNQINCTRQSPPPPPPLVVGSLTIADIY